MKITKELLFYLFVINYHNIDENNVEKLSISLKELSISKIRNLNSIFTFYSSNGNSIEITSNFKKGIEKLISKKLIELNSGKMTLTTIGKLLLKENNLKDINDLNLFMFKRNEIQTDEKSKTIYIQALNYLTIKKHTTKRYFPFNFNINNQLLELFFNGMIEITYRNKKMEFKDIDIFSNNENYQIIAKKYFYFSLVKPYNREEEYFKITNKGLEFLKNNCEII